MSDAPAKGPPCCPIGGRVDADGIAERLRYGAESITKMAQRLGVSYSAIQRHAKHLTEPPGSTPRIAANTPGNDTERVHPEARPVLEDARRLQRRASRLLRKLEEGDESVDFKAASGLLGAIHKALELQAKLLGEIKAAGTTVNVYQTADWQRLRGLLIDALATDHPAALDAVIATIAAEEERATIH